MSYCNEIKINMIDGNDDIHAIRYLIFDSGIAKRWIDLINSNNKESNTITSDIKNWNVEQINTIKDKLDECVNIINKDYDTPLPTHGDKKLLDTEILNFLHEEFEVYGDRIEDLTVTNPVEWWNHKLHDAFLKLNSYIHLYEDLLLIKNEGGFPNMSALIDYLPGGRHEELQDIDYLFMTTQFKWGGLYLGYNTLGKDYLGVFKDNDLEVLERDQVRPQQHFASESWLNFNSGRETNVWTMIKWEKWYNSLSTELQAKIPVNSRRHLGLGRIYIGELDLKHLPLRESIEPQLDKWNQECQSQWNKKVFTTFTGIHSIEILR